MFNGTATHPIPADTTSVSPPFDTTNTYSGAHSLQNTLSNSQMDLAWKYANSKFTSEEKVDKDNINYEARHDYLKNVLRNFLSGQQKPSVDELIDIINKYPEYIVFIKEIIERSEKFAPQSPVRTELLNALKKTLAWRLYDIVSSRGLALDKIESVVKDFPEHTAFIKETIKHNKKMSLLEESELRQKMLAWKMDVFFSSEELEFDKVNSIIKIFPEDIFSIHHAIQNRGTTSLSRQEDILDKIQKTLEWKLAEEALAAQKNQETMKRQPKPEPIANVVSVKQNITHAATSTGTNPQVVLVGDNLASTYTPNPDGSLTSVSNHPVTNVKTVEPGENKVILTDDNGVHLYDVYDSQTGIFDGAYQGSDTNTVLATKGNSVTPLGTAQPAKEYYTEKHDQTISQAASDTSLRTTFFSTTTSFFKAKDPLEKPSTTIPVNQICGDLPNGQIAATTNNGLQTFNTDQTLTDTLEAGRSGGCAVYGNNTHTIDEASRNLHIVDATTKAVVGNITFPGPIFGDPIPTAEKDGWVMGNGVLYAYSNGAYTQTVSVPGAGRFYAGKLDNAGVLHFVSNRGYYMMDKSGSLSGFGNVQITGGGVDIAVSPDSQKYTWIAGASGLVTIDRENRLNPRVVSTLPFSGNVTGVAVPPQDTSYVLVTTSTTLTTDLSVVNTTDPGNPFVPYGISLPDAKGVNVINGSAYTEGSLQRFNLDRLSPEPRQALASAPKDFNMIAGAPCVVTDTRVDLYSKDGKNVTGSWVAPPSFPPLKEIVELENNRVAVSYGQGAQSGVVILDTSNTKNITALLNIRCEGGVESFTAYRNNLYVSEASRCAKTVPDANTDKVNIIAGPDGNLFINITDQNGLIVTDLYKDAQIQISNITAGGQIIDTATGLPIDLSKNPPTIGDFNSNKTKLTPGSTVGNGPVKIGDGSVSVPFSPTIGIITDVQNPSSSSEFPFKTFLIAGSTVLVVGILALLRSYCVVKAANRKYTYGCFGFEENNSLPRKIGVFFGCAEMRDGGDIGEIVRKQSIAGNNTGTGQNTGINAVPVSSGNDEYVEMGSQPKPKGK